MPMRDHFRPPVSRKCSWEGFHAMWPGSIVRQLRKSLPAGYSAEPRVHLGTVMEIDVGAYEAHESPRFGSPEAGEGIATSTWTTSPVVAVDTDPPDEYEYEVRIFDNERERRLVAAIELVSPANKDRPESRGVRCQMRRSAEKRRCGQHRGSRHRPSFQLVRTVDGFRRAPGSNDVGGLADHLRVVRSVAHSRKTSEVGVLAAAIGYRQADADPASVAERRSLHLARSGNRLRGSLCRPGNCVSCFTRTSTPGSGRFWTPVGRGRARPRW